MGLVFVVATLQAKHLGVWRRLPPRGSVPSGSAQRSVTECPSLAASLAASPVPGLGGWYQKHPVLDSPPQRTSAASYSAACHHRLGSISILYCLLSPRSPQRAASRARRIHRCHGGRARRRCHGAREAAEGARGDRWNRRRSWRHTRATRSHRARLPTSTERSGSRGPARRSGDCAGWRGCGRALSPAQPARACGCRSRPSWGPAGIHWRRWMPGTVEGAEEQQTSARLEDLGQA
jgi:hypothetical protein